MELKFAMIQCVCIFQYVINVMTISDWNVQSSQEQHSCRNMYIMKTESCHLWNTFPSWRT